MAGQGADPRGRGRGYTGVGQAHAGDAGIVHEPPEQAHIGDAGGVDEQVGDGVAVAAEYGGVSVAGGADGAPAGAAAPGQGIVGAGYAAVVVGVKVQVGGQFVAGAVVDALHAPQPQPGFGGDAATVLVNHFSIPGVAVAVRRHFDIDGLVGVPVAAAAAGKVQRQSHRTHYESGVVGAHGYAGDG